MLVYVIKSINTIMKKILSFLIILILILIFNKLIVSKLMLLSFEKWIKKEIIVGDFNIFYKKGEILLSNIIVTDQNEDIFTAKQIALNFKLDSFFTKLIIIKKIKVQKPTLNLKFDISNERDQFIKDNLGVSKSIEQKKNPKIYPKKIVDINFLVENSNFEEFTVNIKRLDNNFEESITLSNMHFAKFGNELGYQHYKDIFKIILLDFVMRISDQDLRKMIKKYYKS